MIRVLSLINLEFLIEHKWALVATLQVLQSSGPMGRQGRAQPCNGPSHAVTSEQVQVGSCVSESTSKNMPAVEFHHEEGIESDS